MKYLLSILIFLSLTHNAFAAETYLGCWKEGSDELVYEIDINFEQKKLWIDDYLNTITVQSESTIIAVGQNGTVVTRINRLTGELTENLMKSDGSFDLINTLYCKKLKQLF